MRSQWWRKALKGAVDGWIEGALALDPMAYALSHEQDAASHDAVVDVPVLIVGAGPTGLMASLSLAHHGVPSLVVERHLGTTIYPRAIGVNTRTMEILRSLGLEAEVRRAAFDATPKVARSQTLVDPEPQLSPPFNQPHSGSSPVDFTLCSQQALEPILHRAASAHPQATFRFNTQLLSLQQMADGVCAVIEDRTTNRRHEVRCRYVVAADGGRSTVRQLLGIEMAGDTGVGHNLNIHFRAPIAQRLPTRPFFLHRVQNDRMAGVFYTTDGRSQWVLVVNYRPRCGESPADFSDERAAELIRGGAGMRDLPVEITALSPWETNADMATSSRIGRVFLAGDAAHRMTPAGALGMNTGIQDAHNLAWKLAAVLHGWGGPGLLDTYEDERRPVALANVERSLALHVLTGLLDVDAPGVQVTPSTRTALDFDLGFTYESAAVVADGTPEAGGEGDYVPSARPGGRLPHVWARQRGRRVSTLDLTGPHFTVLVDGRERRWRDAARRVAHDLRVPIRCESVRGAGDAFAAAMGLSATGAVVVRPDGHVAWRCAALDARARSSDAATALTTAVGRALCLGAGQAPGAASAPRWQRLGALGSAGERRGLSPTR